MQAKTALKTLREKTRDVSRNIYQFIRYRPGCINRHVFIVGCQRSGTTMLGRSFANDLRVKEYGEFGLADSDLRIYPLDVIESIAAKQHAPIMVVKPLVESHRTLEILNFFPNSSAIWMLRHYKDVANSSFRKFGVKATRINLGSIVRNDNAHWMSEAASDPVREVIQKYYDDNMPPLDGKALIWYARNSLFFEQRLQDYPRVKVIQYDDIVSRPSEIMREIYKFIDVDYAGDKIVAGVHKHSVGLGKELELNPEIESLCEKLWQQFQSLPTSK